MKGFRKDYLLRKSEKKQNSSVYRIADQHYFMLFTQHRATIATMLTKGDETKASIQLNYQAVNLYSMGQLNVTLTHICFNLIKCVGVVESRMELPVSVLRLIKKSQTRRQMKNLNDAFKTQFTFADSDQVIRGIYCDQTSAFAF